MLAISRDLSTEPKFPIREVTDSTGISAYTLRYYDKCGFFPNLYRSPKGTRRFSEADIAHLQLVDALRKSGLSIDGIRYFVRLENRDDDTTDELASIIDSQRTTLEYRIAESRHGLELFDQALGALQKTPAGPDGHDAV